MTYRGALALVLFACLLDGIAWAYLQSPFPHFSRAFCYTLIFTHASIGTIGVVALMSMIPYFYLAGTFGTDLVLLVPIGCAYYLLKDVADLPIWLRIVAVSSAVFLQYVLLEVVLQGITLQPQILILAFLSGVTMVYLSTGSQGNRSLT